MTATAASRARSPTWRSRVPSTARSASTACPRRSGRSAKAYYDMLEATQKGTLDITPWLQWFLGCLDRALRRRGEHARDVLRKARFWEDACRSAPFNDRQRDMLNRLARRVRGQAHHLEMGAARQMLAGHGRCATSTTSSSAASWQRTQAAAAARVIRLPRNNPSRKQKKDGKAREGSRLEQGN